MKIGTSRAGLNNVLGGTDKTVTAADSRVVIVRSGARPERLGAPMRRCPTWTYETPSATEPASSTRSWP